MSHVFTFENTYSINVFHFEKNKFLKYLPEY
jgi:hypothetical protein